MLSISFPCLFRKRFQKNYECFPISKMENKLDEMEHGGKIILPRSAMQCLGLQSFLLTPIFKLTSTDNDRSTHVGILEFTADEGSCYIPDWIQRSLHIRDGDVVCVEQVSLPVAKFVKFQPIGLEFLGIKNPRALLEIELTHYACLTKGDVIQMPYKSHIYELRVLEMKPEDANAVAIIVKDLDFDFEVPECPVAYCGKGKSLSFTGIGLSVYGGRDKKTPQQIPIKPYVITKPSRPHGMLHLTYSLGELQFNRNAVSITDRVFPINPSLQSLCPGKGFPVQSDEVD